VQRNGQHSSVGSVVDAGLDPMFDTPIPPVPGQSENLVFFGHDPKTGLSFWSHLGRLAPDGSIWEGIFALYLTDGSVLSHRSIGRSVLTPATAQIRYEPVEPLQRWALHLDGVAQRISLAEAGARPVSLCHGPDPSSAPRDPYEPLRVDLEFTGTSPVHDTDVSGQDWGSLHIHQLGRIRGTVKHGSSTIAVDFIGGRDHTRGPRDFTTLAGEWWATCTFPSGRSIDLLQTWHTDGAVWFSGVIRDADRTADVLRLDPVPLSDTLGGPDHFDIKFETESASVLIAATVLNGLPYTLIRPTGFLPGVVDVDPSTLIAVEGAARYTWDGESAYGWIERCRPLSDLTLSMSTVPKGLR
jgi:hypothetical protein